jgi:hypothetical protein
MVIRKYDKSNYQMYLKQAQCMLIDDTVEIYKNRRANNKYLLAEYIVN